MITICRSFVSFCLANEKEVFSGKIFYLGTLMRQFDNVLTLFVAVAVRKVPSPETKK